MTHKTTYYACFKDYDKWIAFDLEFKTRKAAIKYLADLNLNGSIKRAVYTANQCLKMGIH